MKFKNAKKVFVENLAKWVEKKCWTATYYVCQNEIKILKMQNKIWNCCKFNVNLAIKPKFNKCIR